MSKMKQGFSMMEVMVAIMIAAIVAMSSMTLKIKRIQESSKELLIAQQADDMRNLSASVRDYMTANGAGWPNNSNRNVTMLNLIGANLLPAGITGLSPLGLPYVIVANKSPAGVVTAIIYDAGTLANVSQVETKRAGISTVTVGTMAGLKRKMALYLAIKYETKTGVISAMTSTIEGASPVFSINTGTYGVGLMNLASVAVVVD